MTGKEKPPEGGLGGGDPKVACGGDPKVACILPDAGGIRLGGIGWGLRAPFFLQGSGE